MDSGAATIQRTTLYTLGKRRPAGVEFFVITLDNGMGALPLWNDPDDASRFIDIYQPGPADVLPIDGLGLVEQLRYLIQRGVGYLAISPVATGGGTASFVPILALEYLAWVEEEEMGARPVV